MWPKKQVYALDSSFFVRITFSCTVSCVILEDFKGVTDLAESFRCWLVWVRAVRTSGRRLEIGGGWVSHVILPFEFFPDGFWHAMPELHFCHQPTNRPTDGPTSAYRTIFQGRESTSEPIRKDGLVSLCMRRKCFVKSDLCCLDLELTRMNTI